MNTMKTPTATGPSDTGGYHISTAVSARTMRPASIQGLRRPQRERVLSDRCPISGSVARSRKRGMERAMPIHWGFTAIAMV